MNKKIYLAQFIIETTTPFAIRSGDKGINIDSLVARDANDLPYLPGTSLTGVLRSLLASNPEMKEWDQWFGNHLKDEKLSSGSRLILTDGYMVDEDGKTVLNGLQGNLSSFAKSFKTNIIRDRVKINAKGVAINGAKFDEELIPKGVRFSFMLELLDDKNEIEDKHWLALLEQFNAPEFRLGSGTRNGRGVFEIKKCCHRVYHLGKQSDLKEYLSQEINPASPILNGKEIQFDRVSNLHWQRYELKLNAKDFFHFGAGFGDNEVDNAVKKEVVIHWDASNKAKWQVKQETIKEYLIPATSIKGALAHRFAFHYNKEEGNFIGKENDNDPFFIDAEKEAADYLMSMAEAKEALTIEDIKKSLNQIDQLRASNFLDDNTAWKNVENDLKNEMGKGKEGEETAEQNKGVNLLFGYISKSSSKASAQRGNVLIQDLYIPESDLTEKLFNHVAIDRYTGGSKAGALFNEKATAQKKPESLTLELFVKKNILEKNPNIKKAWEATLNDLTEGRLPLGGKTNYGHGIFTGQVSS
jgi:CRISPR/Cas system CMR subunit Cmr4 (Cas7 group RAMP superfamily)